MPANDLERIESLLGALGSLAFDRIYPNYLTHPIRLAAAFSRERGGIPRYEDVALGLCHNFRETAVEGQDDVEAAFLSPELGRLLDVLFTNREVEREASYLDTYYDTIEHSPMDLMILKGHDKLDNFLSYVIYDIDVYHKDVVTDWVVPRLRKRAPRLAAYLEQVSEYVFEDSVKRTFREASP
ncbi:hypothetical protein ACTZWW_10425 [Salinarimonas sp. NSM]|uniref:hypothetical protein n=1 Tax=Salinarimonas sp. NSM TaxID=3458003 RepID=UPI004036F627